MKQLLSDGDPDQVVNVAEKMSGSLESSRMRSCAFRFQANKTVQTWNKTLGKGFAFFISTDDSDLNEIVALACFQNSTRVCKVTGMTVHKKLLCVAALQIWKKRGKKYFQARPERLSGRPGHPHQKLYRKQMECKCKKVCDSRADPVKLEAAGRRLLWSTRLSSKKKGVIPPRTRPWEFKAMLGQVD